MIARCEYCRQLSDGLECRKCGAPLRYLEAHCEVEVIIPEGVEIDWDAPGGVLHDYSRRNKINNMTQMFFDEAVPAPSWISRGLVNWRSGG